MVAVPAQAAFTALGGEQTRTQERGDRPR